MNVADDVVEVYAEPAEGRYAVREVVEPGAALRPREIPSVEVPVEGILG